MTSPATAPPTRLAIDGGTPVRDAWLPYGRQTIDEADRAAVLDVLQSDWLTTGPAVARFEHEFAGRVASGAAAAVSSGTAALHAAMFACGIKPGDEVITSPMTFAATANAVRYQGGTVVFADVQPDTLNIDPRQVRERLTPRTRAIVAVDFAGHPAELDALLAIADEHGVPLIEDAAHALGATHRGRPVGSIARMTTFSFHPVKHITSGEGGMVTTHDAALDLRVRTFRNHGLTSDAHERAARCAWQYEMTDLGFNYRVTDMQCALGLSQLHKADRWLARRRAIAAAYDTAFRALAEVEIPSTRPDVESAWHLYVLRLNLDRLRADRDQLFRALRAENIGVNVHYLPVHWHPYYQALGYEKGSLPVCEQNFARLLTLPLWPGMLDGDVADVVTAVERVTTAYRR